MTIVRSSHTYFDMHNDEQSVMNTSSGTGQAGAVTAMPPTVCHRPGQRQTG